MYRLETECLAFKINVQLGSGNGAEHLIDKSAELEMARITICYGIQTKNISSVAFCAQRKANNPCVREPVEYKYSLEYRYFMWMTINVESAAQYCHSIHVSFSIRIQLHTWFFFELLHHFCTHK